MNSPWAADKSVIMQFPNTFERERNHFSNQKEREFSQDKKKRMKIKTEKFAKKGKSTLGIANWSV